MKRLIVLLCVVGLGIGLFAGWGTITEVAAEISEMIYGDPDMGPFDIGMSKEEFMTKRNEYIGQIRGLESEEFPVAPGDRIEALKELEKQEQKRSEILDPNEREAMTAAWTEIGPNPIPNGQVVSGPGLAVSGRTTAIAVHPTNANIVYVGTAQGGLYRSTDGGTTWTPMLDNALSLAIGSVTIAPSQPDTVYVGTGEGNFSSDSFFGVGIYRIDNASTGSPTITGPIGNAEFNGRSVAEIIVHPTDPATIFVASTSGVGGIVSAAPGGLPNRGVYRSTNATSGAPTFAQIGVLASPNNNFSVRDIAIDPSNPSILIANLVVGGGGIYRSTNALAATPTWTQIVSMANGTAGTSNIATEFAAIHPIADANATFYAATGNVAAGTGNGRILKSTDGGATFSPINTLGFCNPQCFYNIAIDVDPANVNNVYVGGTGSGRTFARSSNGGTTFTGSESGLHTDTQVIAVAPSSPSTIYFGSDGGIYKSTDSGATWSTLNNTTFRATQFMSISVHPTNGNFTIGGTQDNGTEYRDSAGTWVRSDGGDGGYSQIDQNAADLTNVRMYHTYFNSVASALMGYGTTGTVGGAWGFRGCNGATANGISCTATAVQFYAPIQRGPGNPNTIYFGNDRLLRSADNGTNHTVVSQNPIVNGVAISAIGISPQNDNVRAVGLTNGALWGTTTGSSTLTDLDTGNAVPNAAVARVVIDPQNVNTAWVTLSAFNTVNVWKTTNLNNATPTWTAANGTGANVIPQVPVNAFIVDPLNSNIAYAGTDIGVYSTNDGGVNWIPFGTGLPRVAVFDIAKTASNLIRIATHGRGMWETAAIVVVAPTTTFISGAPNPSLLGQNVNVLANVTSGGNPVTVGTMTFIEGGTCGAPTTTLSGPTALNGLGQASFNTTTLTGGLHNITGCYSGDVAFLASNASYNQEVKVPTTTTVTSSANPVVQGQPLTITATVAPVPTGGTITFIEGGTCALPGTVLSGPTAVNGSGQATFNGSGLSIGTHTIVACYSGTIGFTSSSGSVVQVILNPIFTYNASTNPLSQQYTLRVNGTNYEIRDTLTNALLAGPQPIAGTTQIIINGQNALFDILTVDFGGGNITIPVTFNGGTGGPDSLNTFGGSFTTCTSTPSSPNNGTLVCTGGPSSGSNITYTGLEPINDFNVVVNYIVIGTNNVDNISIINNPANNNTLQINSGATPTFELINFLNKTNITINGLQGADRVVSNFTLVPAGPTSIFVDGGAETDEISVISLPSLTMLSVNTQNGVPDNTIVGNSLVNFGNGTGSLLNVNGVINVTDTGGVGSLFVDDSGDLQNRTFTQTAIAAVPVLGGPGFKIALPFSPSAVNYGFGIVEVTIAGGAGADTFNIQAGGPGTTIVNGGNGDDQFNVVGAGFTNNGIYSFNGNGGLDSFNVSPAPNALNASFSIDGGAPTTFPGDTLVVNTAGVTAPVLAINSSGNGTFTSTSHSTINIASIEIQAGTTTTIAATAATTYGGPVTFTATVATQAPGVGAPTGTVTFTADGLPIAACAAPVAVAAATATTSTASCTTSVLSAGVHAISAVYTPTGYYTASTGTSTHTVNKASLTVIADPQSKTYGAVNPTLTATITGFVLSQTLATSGVTGTAALSTTATQTSPVGTYPISVSVGTLQSSNYTFTTFVPGTLTVGKATLTYTADNQTRVFGAANPTPTFTVTGFVAGDTLATSGVTGAPTIAHTATAASTVAGSPYAITISAGSLASANYLFAFAAGSLAVTPAATTTTITNAASLAATTTVGQTYPVNVTVAPVAPSTGTPTGTITVSDGAGQTCTITAPSGTCNLTATAPGPKAVTASYPGDGNFSGSNSGVGVPHNVVIGVTGNIKQFIAFGTNTNLAGVPVSLTGSGTASTTTDANGNYSFGIATAGGSYTVTPSGLGKQYEAVSRSYTSVTTNISGADFIAYDVPGPNALPRGARIQNTLATAGQPVTLPVLLNGTGVERVISFSMETNTTVLGIPTVSCGVDTVGCTLAVDNTLPGKVGIRITTVGALGAGLREIAKVTYPTFATTLSESPVRFGDFPTARDIRNSDNNPLPTLYWTDGIVRFSGGTLIGGPSISGRVLTPNGQGLRSALVVLTDVAGNRRTVNTGTFGTYTFENLEAGQTYTVTVDSKRFRFAPRIINLTDSLIDVDMVGMQ